MKNKGINKEVEKEAMEYIILLLGVDNKPVPSMLHLQMELFILSKVNPKLQALFNFENKKICCIEEK